MTGGRAAILVRAALGATWSKVLLFAGAGVAAAVAGVVPRPLLPEVLDGSVMGATRWTRSSRSSPIRC